MARASEKTYFITFEGIDLCGKDTQLHRFASLIRDGDRLNNDLISGQILGGVQKQFLRPFEKA